MAIVHNIAIVIAFVLFALAAYANRNDLGWAGLALLTLDAMIFSTKAFGLLR